MTVFSFFSVAGITSAGVISAGVVFAVVVVMIAVKVTSDLQRTIDKGFGDFPDIAGGSADNFDTGIGQGIDRSAADAAADKQINFF